MQEETLQTLRPILLVEDESAVAHSVSRVFQGRLQNPVRVMETPADAIRYMDGQGEFADRTAYPLPILVMVDVKVSDKSGFEVLGWAKNHDDEIIRAIPMAILTHLLDTAVFRDVYSLGADAFFSKPLIYQEFDEWLIGSKKIRLRITPTQRFLEAVSAD